MTDQEIFDQVWDWFIVKGNPRALEQDPSSIVAACRYRTRDGRKCAFGVLIPDDKYTPKMEGLPGYEVIAEFLPEFRPNRDLIIALQTAHDGKGQANLEREFRGIAQEFGLRVPGEGEEENVRVD